MARLNQPDVKKQQTGDETGSGQTGSADLKRVISGPDRMVVPCMTSRGLSSLAYQPEPQLGCQADFFFLPSSSELCSEERRGSDRPTAGPVLSDGDKNPQIDAQTSAAGRDEGEEKVEEGEEEEVQVPGEEKRCWETSLHSHLGFWWNLSTRPEHP